MHYRCGIRKVMKVYNCGMISFLATQKPNDGAMQYTKAINGNVDEEVQLGGFLSSKHIDQVYLRHAFSL